MTYFILGILSTILSHLLQRDYSFLRDINIWPPMVTIGIYSSTLSAAMSNLIGASRILFALSKDHLFGEILEKHMSCCPKFVICFACKVLELHTRTCIKDKLLNVNWQSGVFSWCSVWPFFREKDLITECFRWLSLLNSWSRVYESTSNSSWSFIKLSQHFNNQPSVEIGFHLQCEKVTLVFYFIMSCFF